MGLDIFKLAHADDFDLNTAALGLLKCWYPNIDRLKSALQGQPSELPNEQSAFIQSVLLASAHRPTEGDELKENPLTEEEARQVTRQELDEFAAKQAKRIYHRLDSETEPSESPYLDLLNALREDDKARRIDLEKIREQYSHAFTKNSTLGAILKNIEASSALGATLSAIKKHSPLFEAPPPLALETIRPINFKNPVLETNTKLDKFLEGIEEVKPVITQTAGMLQSLNDAAREMQNDYIDSSSKAERQAKNATRLAVIGILISALGLVLSTYFSYRTMKDGEVAAQKASDAAEEATKDAAKAVGLLQIELQAIKSAVENSKKEPIQPAHNPKQKSSHPSS